jgi:non-specific serine/threonine protein kinase/serine/threonine-protein kinase
MGAVYLAEQAAPLRRRVAVKVIKLGMDTREVVARFEGERQMLAMMSHPSIATVFEAGATERGRPYFVMEYVEGSRITEYCDGERLTVPERLELFLQVCGAVQHAHQKGIIHRDLKPSNVLVEARDGGDPTPKVIDFGVAKATGPGVPERTLLTRRGAWIGTPAYMSPEAAWGTALEADSRTDIYALGVLLYELLCGTLPFDPDRLHRATEEEVRRILREEEPPPPSQRLAGLGEAAQEVARRRGTDPAALGRRLRGDLDWIVMRAMEKDRSRRYASVSELAADLLRHLHDQPVAAGPPGAAYRLRKLVRRHKLAVAAAAAVLLALLLGIAGTTAGLLQARAAERTARQEARTAQAVSDFLVGLFEVSDPGEARGNTITAREILDDGAREIRDELEEEPTVQARLLGTMGTVYRKLGLYGDAAPLLEDSVRIQESRAGADPAELARALKDLGTLEVELGRYQRGRELLERGLKTLREAPATDEAVLAEILKELAVLYYFTGDPDRAEPLYQESLEIARRVLGPEDPLVAWVLNDLGNIARDREEYAEAEGLFRRSLQIHETLYGPVHPYVANNLNNLANSYQYQGEYELALPLRERAQAIYEKVLGLNHRLYALGLTNLALLHQDLGAFQEAEELYLQALEARERALGPDHADVAVSLYHLAGLYRDQGRYERAEPLYERALEVGETALGRESSLVGIVLHGFAGLYRATGDPVRSESLLRRALDVLQQAFDPRHSRVTTALAALGEVLVRQGRHEEAEALFARALAVQRDLHARHPEDRLRRADLATSLLGLGRLHQARGEIEEARRCWGEALDLMAPVAAASDAVVFLHVYAVALLHLDRADEARPAVEKLLATGWRGPDLLDLCRRQGLL